MIATLEIQPSKRSKRLSPRRTSAIFEVRCWLENFKEKEWFLNRPFHMMMFPRYIIKKLREEKILEYDIPNTTLFEVHRSGLIVLPEDPYNKIRRIEIKKTNE